MSENLIEKIKDEIEQKTGHSVSIKVSIILQKKRWFLKNALRYPLNTQGNDFGELDLIGIRKSKLIQNTFDNLIIECKKQTQPWVFFQQNWKNEKVLTLNHNRIDENNGAIYDFLNKEGIFKKHYYYHRKLATYYFVPFTNPDQGPAKTIEKAINQVLRATIFFLEQLQKSTNNHFFYPIIIFDGEILK